MMTLDAATWRAAMVGRWTARVVGTLMALFFLAFVVGEGPPPIFRLSWRESLEFVGMAGLFLGLVLAWKWERCGGLVTLASFAALSAINWRFGPNLIFLIPAAAGAVHILCGWRIASGPAASGTAWKVPGTALWIGGAVVGIFILLCANEMFGQPPLMTPTLRPPAEMVGWWCGEGFFPSRPGERAALLISADGTVAGHIGDTAVASGRIRNNRSWFGNLMHWRDPYEMSGAGFTAGAAIRGREMRAFLCFSGSPTGFGWRLTLRKQ
jgi:hypothetical protein